MEQLTFFLNIILHINEYISFIIQYLGNWSYLLLFLIIFCETGFVIFPFLPGDSLLFAIGLTAVVPDIELNIHLVAPLLVLAVVLGDSCNYAIGRFIGKKIFKENAKILKTQHLEKTQNFFNKHGKKSIILARFMPIIRTFTPFVAGMSKMNYIRFVSLGLLAGIIWVYSVMYTAYLFSNNNFVKTNFSLFIIGIIVISLIPAFISVIKMFKNRKNN